MPDLTEIRNLTYEIEEQVEELEDVTEAFLGYCGERKRALNRLYDIAEEIRSALNAEPEEEE